MPDPLFISYFTAGTPYQREAAELAKTLIDFGLPHEIVERPNAADWCANCAQKPMVVRNAMLKHEGRPLVFVDADARIMQRPTLFNDLDCDIAYHLFRGRELLSSTLYFGATPMAWELVQNWTRRCQDQPGVWDQKHLQAVVKQMGGSINARLLPIEYAYIFDCGVLVKPVIQQNQASRKHKRAICRTD